MLRQLLVLLLALPAFAGPPPPPDVIVPVVQGDAAAFCMGPFTDVDGYTVLVPASVKHAVSWEGVKNGQPVVTVLDPWTQVFSSDSNAGCPSGNLYCTDNLEPFSCCSGLRAGTCPATWGVVIPSSAAVWMSGGAQPSEDHQFCYVWPIRTGQNGTKCITFPLLRSRTLAAMP